MHIIRLNLKGNQYSMTTIKECKNCFCKCHCDEELHTDEYGVCTCEGCKCEDFFKISSGSTFEEPSGFDEDSFNGA